MNYVARKRCTCLSSTTIFANRIVPGQVHLPRHLRPLCPGVSPTHLNPGERRRLALVTDGCAEDLVDVVARGARVVSPPPRADAVAVTRGQRHKGQASES